MSKQDIAPKIRDQNFSEISFPLYYHTSRILRDNDYINKNLNLLFNVKQFISETLYECS